MPRMRILALALIALVLCMVVDRHPDPPGVLSSRNPELSAQLVTAHLPPAAVRATPPQLVFIGIANAHVERCRYNFQTLWSLGSDSSPPA